MRFWAVSGNLLQGIAAPRLRPKYTSFLAENHAKKPNRTKIPDAAVAPGIRSGGECGFVMVSSIWRGFRFRVLPWLASFGNAFICRC